MPDASSAEFLLEIGFEEMPAPWLPGLTKQLESRFEELRTQERLDPLDPRLGEDPPGFHQTRTGATPRRLALQGCVLSTQTELEVWGPAVRVAKDKSGNWSNAGLGFARKVGVAPEQLSEGEKDGAETRLLFKKPGEPAAKALRPLIAALLRGLTFPKRMSWDAWIEDGKGAFPFGRPIRWLVALLDGSVVPFEIHEMVKGGPGQVVVKSGDETFGHRFLPRGGPHGPIRVKDSSKLSARLSEAFVILERADRKKEIEKGLATAAGGSVFEDGLVEEWTDLVEYPTVVAGNVPHEFRRLPREVLETVLVHHQKYIPLVEGGSVTRFAAVTNTDAGASKAIVRGMERVVVARLRDAAFFWDEDMKRPLGDKLDDLAGVTFHHGLGTYKDKAERMTRLIDVMGSEMGILTKPEHDAARRAALLAKADLTTHMVREFPELQGVMGGIYLRAEGEAWASVVEAVRWHYHPVSLEQGSVPASAFSGSDSTVFAAVSVADKLDTLAGYFGLGIIPTGSSDPYGLRRAAQGVVRALLDFWNTDEAERPPRLSALIRTAVHGYGKRFEPEAEAIARGLEGFFLDRIAYVFGVRGFPADEIRAVLHPEDDEPGPAFAKGPLEIQALEDVRDAFVRLKALHAVRGQASDDFANLAVAFKRAKNILEKQLPAPVVQPALFQEEAERELHRTVLAQKSQTGGYEPRLRTLARLRAPVDRFFDDVLVMAEDPRVRANRLALLHETLSLFFRIADISKLGGQL